MLSRLDESEPSVLTRGARSCKPGKSGDTNLEVLARDQLRLPSIVLISPLCANILKGCARGQRGKVLVEKRWWNTQIAVASAVL